MKSFVVTPSQLTSGSITVPGDKSISHRSLMLAAIADGRSDIDGLLVGEDCLATLAAMEAMGVRVERRSENAVTVHGAGLHGLSVAEQALDLGNSGTGMRLLTGLLAGQPFDSTLCGDASLSARPMGRVIEPLERMGARIGSRDGKPPLAIAGGRTLKGLTYELPVASAQVKSALLLAGLYADGPTVVTEPAVTRDHSERMLLAMGAGLTTEGRRVRIEPATGLNAIDISVPADLSSAAFFLVAALLSRDCELLVTGVGVNPTRAGVLELLTEMGGDLGIENPRDIGGEPVADLRARSSDLRAIDVAASRVSLAIDEFPVLFVAAAAAKGRSRFAGLEELRVKESDRIEAMVTGLKALGIEAVDTPSSAEIEGGQFGSGRIDSRGDHRIAMAFAIAATRATGPVEISDVAPVDTSFPGFDVLLRSVGGQVDAVEAGG